MIWFAGSSVRINPEFSVELGCGNGTMVDPDTLTSDLEANIMIFYSQNKNSKLALISVDTLYLGADVSRTILEGLSSSFSDSEIFLAATHTHNAPMLDETKPRLGKKNAEYSRLLAKKIVEKTLELNRSAPASASLCTRQVKISGVVSRRKRRFVSISRYGIQRDLVLHRPNRQGVGDLSSTITEIVALDGAILGSIVVFPCHPVTQMGLDLISPDFVGPLRRDYRKSTSGKWDSPFVFLQGSSGDLNPWIKAKYFFGGARGFVDQLVNGPLFTPFSEREVHTWSSCRVAELLSGGKAVADSEMQSDLGLVSSQLISIPLADILIEAEKLDARTLDVHRVTLESFTIVGVSSEITWSLKEELGETLQGAELVGCLRDSFGYLTSTLQEKEGGYESSGHHSGHSILSVPNSGVHEKLKMAILRLRASRET